MLSQTDIGQEAGEITPLPFFRVGVNSPDIAENVALNVHRDLPILSQRDFHDRTLAIVGGGPSLEETWQIIKLMYEDGVEVLALNGAYKFLVEKGVVPDYFFMMDAREWNLKHIEKPQVNTIHVISSQCHPEVFESLEGYETLMVHIGKNAGIAAGKKPYLTAPVGAAGVHGIYVASALGFKDVVLFGYDFSHSAEKHHAFEQAINDADFSIPVIVDKKIFYTTPFLAHVAREFVYSIQGLVSQGLKINIVGEGLLPAVIEEANRRGEIPIEDRERAKYEKMWDVSYHDKYHCGKDFAAEAIKEFADSGSSVVDYGCGSGQSTRVFANAGYEATGVDIAKNAFLEDLPFVCAPLWDLPKELSSDYAFCTDVMEHIPPEKVFEVIKTIYERTRKGAYFNISTVDDISGTFIGQRLHLTVLEAKAWIDVFKEFWASVEARTDENQVTLVCRR